MRGFFLHYPKVVLQTAAGGCAEGAVTPGVSALQADRSRSGKGLETGVRSGLPISAGAIRVEAS
jgi:hypothetical protein